MSTVFCSKPLYLEPCFWWIILVSWCLSTFFLNPIPTWASYITYQWHHLLISLLCLRRKSPIFGELRVLQGSSFLGFFGRSLHYILHHPVHATSNYLLCQFQIFQLCYDVSSSVVALRPSRDQKIFVTDEKDCLTRCEPNYVEYNIDFNSVGWLKDYMRLCRFVLCPAIVLAAKIGFSL